MKRWMCLLSLGTLILFGCSKTDDAASLADRLETLDDCFEPLYGKVDALLDLANSWRMNTTTPNPDPPGLTWMEELDGSVTVTLVINACTLSGTIVFYSPLGVAQDLDLSAATTLSEAIDAAATALDVAFPGGAPEPFMVGDWMLTGPGLTGAGALTGIIGGTTNMNELESVSTTTAMPNGGPPPAADGVVSIVGPPDCELTFSIVNLQTDTVVDQQYPIGTILMRIVGTTTVNVTITFDNTAFAMVVVAGVDRDFVLNLDTGDLSEVK